MFFFRAIFEVIIVHRLLKKHGFGDTVKIYEKKYGSISPRNNSKNKDDIKKFLSTIDKVCFMFWGNAECLHRSLVGFKILRQMGIEVNLVVGVKKFPFSSHAWLELNDRIINDSEDMKAIYTEILRIGAK
jgi:hypothetical protein